MKTVRSCFMCNSEIGKKIGNETVEHIPMRSLYDGYSNEYKINRITVPSCVRCNNETSVLDENFRNFIASISQDPRHMVMADKTVRSVLEHRKAFDLIYRDKETGLSGLLTHPSVVVDYQKKIFKGLFYHQYKYPLPIAYQIKVDVEVAENNDLSIPFIKYYEKNFEYKNSGSPDVFRYILQPYRSKLNQHLKTDLNLEPADRQFISIQVFNNCFVSVVYAHIPTHTYHS